MNSLLEKATLPDSLLHKWKSIRQKMNNDIYYASSTVFVQDQSASKSNLQLLYIRQEYDQVLDSIFARIPQFFEQQFSAREEVVPKVFAALHPSTILLDYFVGGTDLYLFFLKDNKLDLLLLGKTGTVERLVNDVLESALRVSMMSYYDERIIRASKVLLPDSLLLRCNSIQDMIIVADAFLNNLPFELLFYNRQSVQGLAGNCQFPTKYYYSASFLATQD